MTPAPTKRIVSMDYPPIIFVSREECDRWDEDAELRSECISAVPPAAGVAMVCTEGGYLVATIDRRICGGCAGSGMASTFGEDEHRCRRCNGAGFTMEWAR